MPDQVVKATSTARQFYQTLFVLFGSVLLLISCENSNDSITTEYKTYFDASLLTFTDYIHSSIPAHQMPTGSLPAQTNRARIFWYNILPSATYIRDILGDTANVNPEQAAAKILDIQYLPSKNGIYNTGDLPTDARNNWGGLFRPLPMDVVLLSQKNNLVMNIWINIVRGNDDAILFVDLGQISEDIIPNGHLDTEDQNYNDLIDPGEDLGIDNLGNQEEPNYPTIIDYNNDDYALGFNTTYEKINGLENNSSSVDIGPRPDTEDINHNFVIERANNYYSFRLPLDKNEIVKNRIVKYGENDWIKLKIPVDLPDETIGNFDKSRLETIRLWVSGSNEPVHFKIAEIKFETL